MLKRYRKTISSTESSPATSESSRGKDAESRRPKNVIDVDSDTSYGTAAGSVEESPQPTKPGKTINQRRLVWESDSDDEGNESRKPP